MRALTLRAGGDLTRVSEVFLLEPIVGDPSFAYTPINKGRIDIASGYLAGQLVTSRFLDAFASYHVTLLDESDPVGKGIPLARHTAAVAAVWRPLPDLSLFARGTYASRRTLSVITAASEAAEYRTLPTVRSAVGCVLTDVIAQADLELSIDNPLLLEADAPYRVDGVPAPLVERRRGTEVFATLRYDR
ncbi:MAG: hypothetical protein M3680_30335 [Myxococcota bacterium]|nr:hypothetical protein [Myxococcota bacterium]